MGGVKDEDRLNKLRERLYSRGQGVKKRPSYALSDKPEAVPDTWQSPPKKTVEVPPPPPEPVAPPPPEQFDIEAMAAARTRRKKYRLYVILAGFLFFFLAVGVSSLFFIFGSNRISGENIAITINGPFTVGGGEAIPLQIGITNQNAVPIESATLIMTYPPGTQSVSEPGKELFIERLSLDQVSPGETLNVPVRAVVFGEENEEKTIEAEIEYRVEGSNSTFAKIADPLRFKIGSSPVVIHVDSLQKVSSGQESEVTLTISSNSPNPLTELLVRAEYPSGFDYTSSEPAPASGQNVWFIDRIEPESETTITITGVVSGQDTDEYAMHFSVGVPNERDRLALASVFSTASTDFIVEQPFIDVVLSLDGESSGVAAVEPGQPIRVEVEVSNTLADTIYDGRVALALSGNALSDYDVDTTSGFYDSIANTILWDSSSVASLREIEPGETVTVRAIMRPDPDIEVTPQLAFDVNVRARRVTEGQVTEELIGTAAGVAKVSSEATLLSEVGRDTSIFTDTGPIPPVAEEPTTYTITFFTENTSNDLDDVEVSGSLPVYVRWLDKTTGAGTLTFNETSRTVTWRLPEVAANQSKIAAFQVELLPSKSQIGTNPTLVGEQRLRATDRFTETQVTGRATALTTRLSEEAGYPPLAGDVVDSSDD